MEQELYFERDDKLGRKRYAEFLKKLILNSDDFKRDDERRAFSIAIDSPWGTGKSYFLNMFRNYLCTEKDCDMAVVLYNAWENDNWNNAFEPLAQTLFEAFQVFDEDQKVELENAVKAIAILARGVAAKKVEKHISEDVLCEAIEAITKENPNKNIASKEYFAYKEMIERLRECIAQGLARSGKKQLVVIIDELDRCRPDFAVQTMEFVKHLFDAENVVFLFALDMSQLCHSVKSIYGEGMDAEGYLIRFFDYYGKLIEPDMAEFIRQEIGAIPHIEGRIDDFAQTARKLDLSLRDLKMILRVFIQMEKYFLHEYKSGIAHSLYFKLVCVKYKFPSQLKDFLKGKANNPPLVGMLFPPTMEVLALSEPLESTNKKMVCSNKGTVTWTIEKANWKMDMVVDAAHKISCVLINPYRPNQRTPKDISKTSNINGLLFYPDLKKWDQIKDLTPAQYLMQQLEMFDFFQPNNQ
ncbi:P-loop NTPase fold protein [Gemmiger sp. An194]|uniref:KAP family P-loop NTPase fold protein n=1 Tax=Gemmiger sp. An194 TaxID=1965582 RepID=UPI001302E8D5|nr:P-loop NTPase fold protein [Gemmiger sp. An194]